MTDLLLLFEAMFEILGQGNPGTLWVPPVDLGFQGLPSGPYTFSRSPGVVSWISMVGSILLCWEGMGMVGFGPCGLQWLYHWGGPDLGSLVPLALDTAHAGAGNHGLGHVFPFRCVPLRTSVHFSALPQRLSSGLGILLL